MMNDVENEVEEQQAEDGLVNRVPELKQLSEDIDKATNTFINATLELESAIQQYQRAEVQLGGAVTTIGKKVDTINQHINKVLENAPNQLKVSVVELKLLKLCAVFVQKTMLDLASNPKVLIKSELPKVAISQTIND